MSGDITDEETSITEITLQSDGRIFIFGLSRAKCSTSFASFVRRSIPCSPLDKLRSESSIE